MKTFMAKPNEVDKKWYLVDAKDKVLGRLASEVAQILRGKHKPTYTPHIDTGDHVVITNAKHVVLTGKKGEQKQVRHHTGYPGGLKEEQYKKHLKENPEKAVYNAIVGMLPHNKLGTQMAKKLRVYRGANHPHEAQMPEILDI